MGLTRRELLKATGASAVAISLGTPPRPAPPAGAWNHDPASPIGPLHWADVGFPTCGDGTSQSPIDIRTRATAPDRGAALLLSYEISELVVENTGHVVEVPIPAGARNTLRLGGELYDLSQYHFHAPSEHAVDGRPADLEAHFVHTNAQGATAVVGVFYQVGHRSNPVVDRILLSAPTGQDEEADAGEASPADLFRGVGGVRVTHGGSLTVNSFYSYNGSLTTPGCTQDVRWSVLADGGQVSSAAVRRVHQVISCFPYYGRYPNNNRPVQPLDGRTVKLRG